METDYSYDLLNNLIGVTQNGIGSSSTPLTRSFTYDSLSRLLCASNPESSTVPCTAAAMSAYTPGTKGYEYDKNGNVISTTDANGWTTISYGYDNNNRLISKVATSDADTNFVYGYDSGPNNIGHLTGVFGYFFNTLSSGTSLGYDSAGRLDATGWYDFLASTWRAGTAAQFDLAGNMTQLVYPDGRLINQSWSAGGNLLSVADATPNQTPVTYFQATSGAAQYFASGALQNATYGNGVTETFSINNRLQPCRIMAFHPGSPHLP